MNKSNLTLDQFITDAFFKVGQEFMDECWRIEYKLGTNLRDERPGGGLDRKAFRTFMEGTIKQYNQLHSLQEYCRKDVEVSEKVAQTLKIHQLQTYLYELAKVPFPLEEYCREETIVFIQNLVDEYEGR